MRAPHGRPRDTWRGGNSRAVTVDDREWVIRWESSVRKHVIVGPVDGRQMEGLVVVPKSRVAELTAALEKIVAWDDAEKPHKNIPLLDCADLARRTLGLK